MLGRGTNSINIFSISYAHTEITVWLQIPYGYPKFLT